ncbi:MAG: methylenetetrahydrofolate reductase [NAD(P)H] [Dehalococcoidia bacterium]|nr:methylenetetrahydrofolate reductase [NAD(P)H] [Dehalococcoidia bacterium]
MKIRDVLATGRRTISFEFFAPKTDQGVESLFRAIRRLSSHRPDFVSVTYGAGGSTRNETVDLVSRIKAEVGLETMAHVTCVAQTREDVHDVLERLEELGVDNVLALRGDPPRGQGVFVPVEGGFRYASEVITHIRRNFDFGVGAACFPELHPESVDAASDMVHLREKVDAGADYLITQLFFDNRDFFDFMDRARGVGIRVPVLAGILPVLATAQIRRFASLCGASIPPALDRELEKYVDDDDGARELGIEYAARQVEELWRAGVDGIHFYTINRSHSVSRVLEAAGLPGTAG